MSFNLNLQLEVEIGEATLAKLRHDARSTADYFLDRLLGPKPKSILVVRFDDGRVVKGENLMFQLGDANKVTVTIIPRDSRGNVVPPEMVENVVLASSDTSIITVLQNAANPLQADILAVGPLGSAQFQFTFDSLLGEGERLIQGVADIQTVPTAATTADVSFGEQTPQG